MRNGESVAAFERAFAQYVGAKYAIALCNGTATLHTALVALGVQPGDRVAVPPLTMSATTLAVLQAGAVPMFCDVDSRTWLMNDAPEDARVAMSVSLYGLEARATDLDYRDAKRMRGQRGIVDDAAQALGPFAYGPRHGYPDFKSHSFQASKVLPLGEGGMLVTNDEGLATRAREFSSLGYRMRADQPRIDPAVLKASDYARHHWPLAYNYRMNDLTAAAGLRAMSYTGLEYGESEERADALAVRLSGRRDAADHYRQAIAGCDWLTPQHVPEGWRHDYWTYAVACDTPERARWLQEAVVRHGGERPYGAWRLTYQEPAFKHLMPGLCGTPKAGNAGCPVAESLQPRLLQFQTNDLRSAEHNAAALRLAIEEVEG